jgi:uncharacterized membrane protein
MKVTWRSELPMWLLIGAMFLGAAAAWPTAPDQIPVHWGIDGGVDRYGGRFEGLLLLPLVALGVYVAMLVVPKLDPGRLNYPLFAGAYYALRIGLVGFFAVLYGVIHLAMRGHDIDMMRVAPLLSGVLLILVGSVLGKVRPNWFVGVRTPWTLSSKTSWVRTHRLAGWVLMVGGLLLAAAGASGSRSAIVATFAATMAGALWSVVYSYLVWRKDPDRIPPAGTVPSGEEERGS